MHDGREKSASVVEQTTIPSSVTFLLPDNGVWLFHFYNKLTFIFI